MKRKLILISFLATAFSLNAQNVGIGTTTPQATLDVKGNLRTGGINNYILYDSLAGKITWTNSNLWVTGPQYLMKHSASLEGLYSNGAQLEYRNSTGSPTFFTNWSNGNGYFSGDVGIGTVSPQHKLHLFTGASGTTAPFGYNLLALESSGNINMSFLTPDANGSAIWFSKPSQLLGGGIFYNNGTPDGFLFRTNNAPRMVITNAGRVGIGLNSPAVKLHVIDNGGSGGTPVPFSRLAVESDWHTYINMISPDANETAIFFGKASDAASGGIVYNNGSTPNGFQFRSNGNLIKMVINNGGNVGIGTMLPQKNLSVQNGMNIDQADGNTGSIVNTITFGYGSGEGIGSKRNPGGNQWGLDFYTNSTNKMSITTDGNVGIGTSTPAAKLQVSAGDASLALFGPNSTYGAMLYVGSSSANHSTALTAQVNVSDGNLHIDPAAGKNLYFGYFQPRDIFLNANGGKVAIGTTSAPSATLEVNGYTKLGSDAPSIKFKKLTGTTSGGDGDHVNIAHGLDESKILSVSVLVIAGPAFIVGPNAEVNGCNFTWTLGGGNIFVGNRSGGDAGILSKPIRILITYEE